MELTGECFCGGVKYRLTSAPFSPRSCHCSQCRKAFSAQASAYALVRPGSLSWVQGEELLTAYVGRHGGGKLFCRVCGSTLCGTLHGQIHGIALGCLDGDPELTLDTHIFVGSKAPWEVLPPTVKQFDEFPPDWG